LSEVSWASEYVGLEFVDGGRDRRGVDCWGLVRLVYLERLKIVLPDFAEIRAYDGKAVAAAISENAALKTWVSVVAPSVKEYDVVVMRGHVGGFGMPRHVGVVAPYQTVLHIEHGVDAICPRIASTTIKDRIIGFYRHHDLFAD
jgi:cell wall-associated NlpC family hydrolase